MADNYKASFNQWLKDGGEVGINKLIIDWKPLVMAEVTDVETAKKFFDFVDTLNDDDDVQRVASNISVSDEIMSQLEG